MIESHIPQISSYAHHIDNLIMMIGIVVMGWFFAAQAVFFYFIFKFRAKEGQKSQYIEGYSDEEMKWIHRPHNAVLVFDVFILVCAIWVWNHIKIYEPEKIDETIEVVAQRWAWSFSHPGKDGQLGTADDIKTADTMYVKVGDNVRYEGKSRDVLHSFSVPAFRLKQDLIPGRVNSGWFRAEKPGTFDIQCAEICGIGHGIMFARVKVLTAEEHAKWVAENTPTP